MEDDIVDFDLSAVSSTITLDDAINISDTFTVTADDSLTFSYDTSNILEWEYNPGIDVTAGDLTIHEEGDIKIGDRSLKEFMDKMEERLGIYTLNPELENEVEELKELGQKYRELEEKIKNKKKLLDTIKDSDLPSCR